MQVVALIKIFPIKDFQRIFLIQYFQRDIFADGSLTGAGRICTAGPAPRRLTLSSSVQVQRYAVTTPSGETSAVTGMTTMGHLLHEVSDVREGSIHFIMEDQRETHFVSEKNYYFPL